MRRFTFAIWSLQVLLLAVSTSLCLCATAAVDHLSDLSIKKSHKSLTVVFSVSTHTNFMNEKFSTDKDCR